jgi:hypothetical protein
MSNNKLETQFVVCIKNDGYKVSLEPRKIYQVLPDATASKHRMLRIVDESGEDYLFPADLFAPINLPQMLAQAFASASPANSAAD